jgi:hypothetical protein
MRVTERDPYDGRPYYCALCGAGYGEFIVCEMPDCKLETVKAAEKRARANLRPSPDPEGKDKDR